MDKPVAQTSSPKEIEERARYERLLALYAALEEELTNLQAQGKLLRQQAQVILDKQKMLAVLQDINRHTR